MIQYVSYWPIKVTVGVRMIDLMEINDINQTLVGDFAVILNWVDPRLSQLDGCEIPIAEIWSPGLVFLNSGRKFAGRPKEVGIGPGGQVKYVQRYSGTFATYHHLSDFPFDEQTFRISLISLEWSEKDIQLVVNEKVTGQQTRLNISDWIIKGVEGTLARQYLPGIERFNPRYDFNISASRIKAYYLWKVILPLCHVLVRILDKPGPIRPPDRAFCYVDADTDCVHFCDNEYGAQTWLFDTPRPVHCWFDNTGVSGAA